MYPFMLVNAARQNDKRNAYIKLLVEDDIVKNIQGSDKPDNYAIIRLGRKIEDYEKSGLYLPTGIG